MIVSERILEILKEKGISQRSFSEKTGIAQSTISDWKRKKTNPASDKIMVICDALQVSPAELLADTESGTERQTDFIIVEKDSADYRLLMDYRVLSSAGKNRVLGYIQALLDQEGIMAPMWGEGQETPAVRETAQGEGRKGLEEPRLPRRETPAVRETAQGEGQKSLEEQHGSSRQEHMAAHRTEKFSKKQESSPATARRQLPTELL